MSQALSVESLDKIRSNLRTLVAEQIEKAAQVPLLRASHTGRGREELLHRSRRVQEARMSSELIAILTVGIGLLTAIAGLAAVLVTLIIHFDKRATERGDRLQDEMNRQFELMQADMNRQFELMQADMDRCRRSSS